MTYRQNFVVALKVAGKVLRESGGEVELPFGTEYTILLKNLNSVRAQAQITVDGEVAGPWYILEPNSTLEIERWNNTGNRERGNRFKFVERTSEVESHRGVRVDDGLVRVEFKKERIPDQPKIQVIEKIHIYDDYRPVWPRPYVWPYTPSYPWNNGTVFCHNGLVPTRSMGSIRSSSCSATMASGAYQSGVSFQANSAGPVQANNVNAGITVRGSESDQKFVNASGFDTEPSEVLCLKLIGRVQAPKLKVEYHVTDLSAATLPPHSGETLVLKPKTVKTKMQCPTCRRHAKSSAKFCAGCGSALVVI